MTIKTLWQHIRTAFIVLTLLAWVFSGWPQIGNFPPSVQDAQAAQFGRPDSDVTSTNFTNGFAAIDEATASDADYAYSADDVAAELEVGLSDATDPQVNTGHIFRYRIAKVDGGVVSGTQNAVSMTVRLMQGTTEIASDTAKTASGTWTQYELTLSGAQADAITNYADLRLEVVVAAGAAGNPANRRGGAVSWAELEVPDAPAASPTFTLNDYRWYVDNDSENVSDPWGVPDIAENTAITPIPAGNDPPGPTQELRLRVNFTVNTATLSASSQQFKLQFKAGTDGSCTSGTWTDIGAVASSAWQFASSSVTDGTTLTVLKLAASDVLEVYAKANPTATNPNSATTGQDIEYDFHIIGSGSDFANATQYSFRAVESDDTVFDGYTTCPTLTTEPGTGNLLRHGNFFADQVEKGFFWAD